MKYGKIILLLPLIIIFVLTLFFVSKSFAQNTPGNYDVTVSPVFFDLSANPGDTLSNKIRIRNNTTSPIPIKLQIQKMTGDVNGDLTLKEGGDDESITWIKFTSNKFVANPLEWTDVPFTISIPESAAYGYYFAVSFTQDNSSSLKTTGTTITGAAAIPFLLNVRKEGAKAEVKIIEFTTKDFITEYLPVNFDVKLQNTGNVHIKPHGNIFIDQGGKETNLGVLDINQNLASIIPETNRTFKAEWNDGFLVRQPKLEYGQPVLDKNGNPKEELVINWNKLTAFRIGKYTANLLLVYDNGNKDVALESAVSFWVFPWKAIAVIILLLAVLVLIARFLIKFYVNREIKKRARGH
jgi:hypothetical protein